MSHFRLLGGVLLGAALALLQPSAFAGSAVGGPTVKVPLAAQQKLPVGQVKPLNLPCARPRLDDIRPYQGHAGTTLTLTGRCFGPVSNRHVVSLNHSLGGSRPPILQIRSWSDTRIVGVVPRDATPDTYNVYVHVWYNGQKRSSNHRNFTIRQRTGTAAATPKPGVAAHLRPGMANQRPSGLPQVQTRPGAFARSCPDLSPTIRLGWPGRHSDGTYTFKLLMYVYNRGNAAFVTNRQQVRVNIYEGSRLLESRLLPNATIAPGGHSNSLVHSILHWNISGEFSVGYKVAVVYGPDIRTDGNPQNDDCVMSNNEAYLRAADIRHTLESTSVPNVSF